MRVNAPLTYCLLIKQQGCHRTMMCLRNQSIPKPRTIRVHASWVPPNELYVIEYHVDGNSPSLQTALFSGMHANRKHNPSRICFLSRASANDIVLELPQKPTITETPSALQQEPLPVT